jgi:hydroxymethylbilane synthase
MNIKIGSRGSNLALWQAEWVKSRLADAGHKVEIKIIKTTGDRLPSAPLTQSGVKGLFIKEIEEALVLGEVDLAVHSLKDLPVDQPGGLCVAAVPKRADARDVLIARDAKRLAELPAGARVGTSSLRRQSRLAAMRRDLAILPVRGNVDTRLAKLDRGDYDALAIAAAGVQRLGFEVRVTQYFSIDEICPAVGQGALAIEIRKGDAETERTVKALDHPPSHQAVRAERAVLRRLGGGCAVPIAAHATSEGDHLRLLGVVASVDGTRVIRSSATGPADDPERL